MIEAQLELAVIVGSTREGRFAPVVANWFLGEARQRHDLNVEAIDLADVDLPAVLPRRSTEAISSYVARIDRADAYVIVTPEYNHGYPASVKQAIDVAYDEWQAKPVGFVSYGGLSGGLRAVEQLRQVFAEVHAVTVRDTVSFHGAHRTFDASGDPVDAVGPSAVAKTMLDQLTWWARALRAARRTHPYAA